MAKRSKLTRAGRRAKYASARKQLSILKSKGLISKRANLRRDKPSSALLKKLEVLKPTLSGHAQGVKLSSAATKKYKESGGQVFNGRAVFQVKPGQKLRVNKKGDIVLRAADDLPDFNSIIIPVNIKTFGDAVRWVSGNRNDIERQLGRFGLIGYTFYGNSSEAMDLDEFLIRLNHYKIRFEEEDKRPEEAGERFHNLVLFKMKQEYAKYWNEIRAMNREPEPPKPVRTYKDRKNAKAAADARYRASINDRAYRISEAARKKEYRRAKAKVNKA